MVPRPFPWFHALLGAPSRIIPAGSPAPVGHRNNHIHLYDELGITLNEHHYTYQIQGLTIVLDITDAIHPTKQAFSGSLEIGGTPIIAGDCERVLANSRLGFTSRLKGVWFAKVSSAPTSGRQITVAIDSAGCKLRSGRRSKVRRLLTVAICLEHDPWDARYRQ